MSRDQKNSNSKFFEILKKMLKIEAYKAAFFLALNKIAKQSLYNVVRIDLQKANIGTSNNRDYKLLIIDYKNKDSLLDQHKKVLSSLGFDLPTNKHYPPLYILLNKNHVVTVSRIVKDGELNFCIPPCKLILNENIVCILGLQSVSNERGKGHGKYFLKYLASSLSCSRIDQIIAFVEGTNWASQRLFRKSGYSWIGYIYIDKAGKIIRQSKLRSRGIILHSYNRDSPIR